MNKSEFIFELESKLSGLPLEEVEERIGFYIEMIEDRMEDGLSEEEAVLAVGSVDSIAEQILADIPLVKIAKERMKPKRRMGAWEIVLLVVGSPIWLALGLSAFAVVLSVYVCLWAVIICLWAAFASFCGGAIGGIASGVVYICLRNDFLGLALIGAGVVLAGVAILMFYASKAVTKGLLWLTKKTALCIKKRFIKKEDTK